MTPVTSGIQIPHQRRFRLPVKSLLCSVPAAPCPSESGTSETTLAPLLEKLRLEQSSEITCKQRLQMACKQHVDSMRCTPPQSLGLLSIHPLVAAAVHSLILLHRPSRNNFPTRFQHDQCAKMCKAISCNAGTLCSDENIYIWNLILAF